jgi:hypothetical protein
MRTIERRAVIGAGVARGMLIRLRERRKAG